MNETPTDAVLAVAQLADTLGRASTQLFDYRRDNPSAPDADRALNLELALDRCTIALRTQAIRLVGAQAAAALAQLQDATRRVDTFLHGLDAIEARLSLASAALLLAGAVQVGDAGGLLAAVVHVRDALDALRQPAAT